MSTDRKNDPAVDWDKKCEAEERAEAQYIEDNQAGQEKDLDVFLTKLIHFWNPSYMMQNPKMTWNESILLGFYICNHCNGHLLMQLKAKGDALYSILDEFPNIDALENGFTEELDTAVSELKLYLEKID